MPSCFSHVQFFGTLLAIAHWASLSMGFSGQEYWSGLSFPPPGDLPDPGIESRSPALPADSLLSKPPAKPQLAHKTPHEDEGLKGMISSCYYRLWRMRDFGATYKYLVLRTPSCKVSLNPRKAHPLAFPLINFSLGGGAFMPNIEQN